MSEETKKPAEEQTKKAEYISEKAMAEILKGIRQRLPVKEYANKKFSPEQMKQIRLGMKSGISYQLYAAPYISLSAMKQWRKMLEKGVGDKDIIDYLAQDGRSYDAEQIKQIRMGMKDKLDVKLFANPDYSAEQMKQIRLGVKNDIDYEVYANGNFTAEQMQKIRLEMLIAKIIDFIKEKFTQLYQSMKAYANLYMTKLPVEPEEDMSPEDVKDAQLFTLMKRAYDKMNDNYEDFEEMSFDEKVDSIMREFERVNENERTHTVAKSNELIPEGTEKLEERCFSDRKNISDVVIPGSIREIPYMAFASSSVKTAVIEPGVESISSCAFAATDLESISIPDTVKHIGEQAFAMTDITSIEIPASVKAIGYLAFNGCRNLKEVTLSKGTIFDKDTFPEGVNIRYRENEQEQSEPEEEEGFEPEI